MEIKNIAKNMILTVSVLIFTGCLNSEAPECSDSDVKETVKSIYSEIPEKNKDNPISGMLLNALPKSITSLESIRPISYDEKVKLRTCKAQATFENGQTADLQYTVQSVESKDEQFYVEIDTGFIEGLMMQNIMKNAAH